LRLAHLALGTTFVAAFALADVRDAIACGGCFHPVNPISTGTETTSSVVTDHRMVFKISSNETILWDQVRYTGAPEEFAWVLPVREGATIELSRDEFVAALDTATKTTVQGPVRVCRTPNGGTRTFGGDDDSSGCGSSDLSSFSSGPRSADNSGASADAGASVETDDVSVVSQSVIGPYQAVTLRAKSGEGVSEWLTTNKFAIPENVKPTIDAYTKEGFDFIALRLRPGQGVQAMRPVRVVSPGSDSTLPLRMVAAGVGAKVGLTLWVISEGRYQAQSFPNAVIDDKQLIWDGKAGRSNLTTLQASAFASKDGRTWLTEASTPRTFDQMVPGGSGRINSSIVSLYTQQCMSILPRLRPCDEDKLPGKDGVPPSVGDAGAGDAGDGGDAGSPPDAGPSNPDQCLKMVSGCDGWDDLEVAARGMHTNDIWITRMRADLPVAALTTDLRLEAAVQSSVLGAHTTNTFSDANDDPCPDGVLRTQNNNNATSTAPPPDDSACTCRTTKPLRKQTGTWVLIGATAFIAARIARRKRR